MDLRLRFSVDPPLNANQPNQMKTVPMATRTGLWGLLSWMNFLRLVVVGVSETLGPNIIDQARAENPLAMWTGPEPVRVVCVRIWSHRGEELQKTTGKVQKPEVQQPSTRIPFPVREQIVYECGPAEQE
jgi:hypothetical protein